MYPLWKVAFNNGFKIIAVVAAQCRDRHNFSETVLFSKLFQQWQQFRFVVKPIDLVYHQQHRAVDLLHLLQNKVVFIGPAIAIYQKKHQINIFQSRAGSPIHVAVNRLFVAQMQSGGVDIDRLRIALSFNPQQLVARRLGLS